MPDTTPPTEPAPPDEEQEEGERYDGGEIPATQTETTDPEDIPRFHEPS
jgi:hypothetical protein